MFYIKSILLSGDRGKLDKTLDYFSRWHQGLQLYGMHRLLDAICRRDDLVLILQHVDASIRRYMLHGLKAAETKHYVWRKGENVAIHIPVDPQGMSVIKLLLSPLSHKDSVSVRIEWPCESNYELARLLSFMMFTQKLDDYLIFINDDYQTHYNVRQLNAILSAEIAGFNGMVFIDWIQDNRQ